MRVKSRWFKSERPKPPRQVASAVAFIVWRVAQNALKRMRKAQFDIDTGPQYFAFLAELLIFLVAISDRIVYARLAPEAREEFTTALAHRVGDIFGENEGELLGVDAVGSKRRFIALLNERSAEYASFGYGPEGPDFGFVRYLANRVNDIMPPKDQAWAVAQVMESEAPEAVATVEKALRDLLAAGPRSEPRDRMRVSGE
jgi:hypothetical protein